MLVVSGSHHSEKSAILGVVRRALSLDTVMVALITPTISDLNRGGRTGRLPGRHPSGGPLPGATIEPSTDPLLNHRITVTWMRYSVSPEPLCDRARVESYACTDTE